MMPTPHQPNLPARNRAGSLRRAAGAASALLGLTLLAACTSFGTDLQER